MHYHPRKPDEHARRPTFPRCTTTTAPRRAYAVERGGRAADHEVGGGDRPRPRAGPAGRRLHRRQARSRRSPAASCRTSPASTPSSRRPYVEDVRRCGEYDVAVLGAPFDGGTTYRSGHPLRAAGHPQDLRALRPVQLRAGRRPARVASRSRDLGDIFTIPGNIEKTFDQITKAVGARLRLRRLPGRARRRPLDRLPDRARRRPAPATAATSGSSTSTATSTRRRPTSTSGCTPRPGSTPRTSRTCRRRTSSRSASAAGRRRGRA